MKIKAIMTTRVITVTPETPIQKMVHLLYQQGIKGLPVVDNDQLVGIVTESDFILKHPQVHLPSLINILHQMSFGGHADNSLRKEYQQLLKTKAKDIMSKEVVTIRPEAAITDLAELIIKKKVNPVPVVNAKNRLVGIVSKADLLKLTLDISVKKK